jgi:hypothetical protein
MDGEIPSSRFHVLITVKAAAVFQEASERSCFLKA